MNDVTYLNKDTHTHKTYSNSDRKTRHLFTWTRHGSMHITPMSTFGWIVTGREDGRSLVGRDNGWLLCMLVVQRVAWKVQSWYLGPRQTQQTTTRWTVSTLWSGSKTITAQHTGQLSYNFGQRNIPQQTKRQAPTTATRKDNIKKWLDKHNIPYDDRH